jgi:hypothetical protein
VREREAGVGYGMLGLRLGAVALVAAAIGGAFVACGSLAENAGFANGGDAGPQPEGSLPDVTTPSDAPADAPGDSMPPVGPPGAIFVHASPIEDLRFCWSVSSGSPKWSATDPPFPSGTPMPASNYPGLARGGAVPLPDASSMIGQTLTIYGIDANTLASYDLNTPKNANCADRLGNNGSYSVPQTAVFQFPAITMQPVAPGGTYLFVVSGCAPNDPGNASTRLCGSSWSASTGNLRVDVVTIPTPAVDAGGVLVVQAAQLSPALAALAGDAGVNVSFGAQGAADASALAHLTSLEQLLPTTPATLSVGTTETTFQQVGFGVDVPGYDGGQGHTWMSLAESLDLVDPTLDPTKYFAQPTNYVVAVVGDPSAARPFTTTGDAAYDGTGLHVLVVEVQ